MAVWFLIGDVVDGGVVLPLQAEGEQSEHINQEDPIHRDINHTQKEKDAEGLVLDLVLVNKLNFNNNLVSQ